MLHIRTCELWWFQWRMRDRNVSCRTNCVGKLIAEAYFACVKKNENSCFQLQNKTIFNFFSSRSHMM